MNRLLTVVYMLTALGLLFVAMGDSLPSHCADECDSDCQESCDCINCLHHQVLIVDLVPQFESVHGDEVHLWSTEQLLLPQVSDRGIDHPPQNLS